MADDLMRMFQSITTTDHDELIDQFAHLLQTDVNTANFFLESSNWNVELAVNNYLAMAANPPAQHSPASMQDSDAAMDDSDDAVDPSQVMDPEAKFVSDLSQSQNIVFAPQSVVNMQWTFVNSGPIPWPAETALVFSNGEQFNGPERIELKSAAPGERIDIQVSLQMPSEVGSYAGSWRLKYADGFFGDAVWAILNVGQNQDGREMAGGKNPQTNVFDGRGNEVEDMDI